MATLGEALIGSDRPIVPVSGTPWVPGRASTETDEVPTDGPVGGRGRSVTTLLDLASRGARATAVRMPPAQSAGVRRRRKPSPTAPTERAILGRRADR